VKGESTVLRFKGRQKETELMPLLAICTSVIIIITIIIIIISIMLRGRETIPNAGTQLNLN